MVKPTEVRLIHKHDKIGCDSSPIRDLLTIYDREGWHIESHGSYSRSEWRESFTSKATSYQAQIGHQCISLYPFPSVFMRPECTIGSSSPDGRIIVKFTSFIRIVSDNKVTEYRAIHKFLSSKYSRNTTQSSIEGSCERCESSTIRERITIHLRIEEKYLHRRIATPMLSHRD